jgi:hypothetical protein
MKVKFGNFFGNKIIEIITKHKWGLLTCTFSRFHDRYGYRKQNIEIYRIYLSDVFYWFTNIFVGRLLVVSDKPYKTEATR